MEAAELRVQALGEKPYPVVICSECIPPRRLRRRAWCLTPRGDPGSVSKLDGV
jgi:hypothetical protein